MKRAVRNRLVDLLLAAFDSPSKRDEMLWLGLYCEQSAAEDHGNPSVADLMTAWEHRYPDATMNSRTLRDLLGSLRGLFRIVRSEGRPNRRLAVSTAPSAVDLRIRLHPDLCACLSEACDRIRIYLSVLEQLDGRQGALKGMEPLHRAVAQAALCFNVGLFFEAHEHLEHHWLHLEDGATRRFVQGIIQISVGFHHAMRGSYQGAVNQLGKGLAKMAEAPDDALGLDRDRFVREVESARQEMLARGRERMRQAALQELPRMHLLR